MPFKSNTLEFDVERLRESFLAVDEALQALKENFSDLLDKKYYGLEERQYILDARMDVIAGQTTEDGEILDARVDAKGVIHPNVGHNVRNLHSGLLELGESIQERITEIQQLLVRVEELKTGQRENELQLNTETQQRVTAINAEAKARADADAEIRGGLAQEAFTRNEQDEALQAQTDKLSAASLRHSLDLRSEIDQRRKDILQLDTAIDNERILREQSDESIYRELIQSVDDLSSMLGEEADVRSETDNILHEALESEVQTRQSQDEALSARILQNAGNISGIRDDIRHEVSDRLSNDEALQTQADELSKASLQNSLNVKSEAERRRKADEAIRSETAQNLADIAADLNEEAQSRKASDAEIQVGLAQEAFTRSEQDEVLQAQTNSTAEAILRAVVHFQELSGKLKSALKLEETDRIFADDNLYAEINALAETLHKDLLTFDEMLRTAFRETDEALQAQADNLSKASFQHYLDLQNEIDQRRKIHDALTAEVNTRTEQHEALHQGLTELQQSLNDEGLSRLSDDEAQQGQINSLTKAALRNTLDIQQETARRKFSSNEESIRREAADSAEADSRRSDDAALQKQLDSLVFAVLRIALNDYDGREKLRLSIDELFQVVADTGNFTYMGAKIASRSEIGDMLADVLSGTDSGEVSESEIPEALRDKIAASSEVSEMLAEIFPNQNRS